MRIRMLIWMLVCLFPYTAYASGGQEWDKLDRISDEALQMTKNQRFEEAKQLLEYFEQQFLQFNAREGIQSMDALHALTVTHEGAVKTVTASTLPIEERVNQVAQFRLVVDAVQAKHQPLWKEMKETIMSAFAGMKEAMEHEDEGAFQQAFQQFLQRYKLIEPSAKINVEPERFQRVAAHISLLEAPAFYQLDANQQAKELQQMEEDLEALFADGKKEAAVPSLWWVMTSIGGMIVLTLTYVGWRKYRGEKEKRIVQGED
jgi:sporulation protein YpjB